MRTVPRTTRRPSCDQGQVLSFDQEGITRYACLNLPQQTEEVVSTGQVDSARIYVFGWSNGAYMAALYGVWRSERIAAIAQYAGADSWSRTPCPVSLQHDRQVPLVLLRNLCDALVPCNATNDWIDTLAEQGWPFEYHSLNVTGTRTDQDRTCAQPCSEGEGPFEHIRWPAEDVLVEDMLSFLKRHTLQ